MTANNNKSINASVILSTYNNPKYLELSLRSFENQTYQNFEIIIADDGSTDETKTLINHYTEHSDLTIRHIWQEDKGFRKAIILNQAIKLSHGDIIIFSDQDCVVPSHFVEGHMTRKSASSILIGSRKWVSKEGSLQYEKSATVDYSFLEKNSKLHLIEQTHRAFFVRIGVCAGCNFSAHRSNLLEINGFNEDFLGYGSEDAEIGHRLFKHGCRVQNLKRDLFVYHLWHPRNSGNIPLFHKNGASLSKNILFNTVKVKCLNGILKY